MAELDAVGIVVLLIAAFAAGFVDSIVGGGGLITTPTLLLVLPNAPVAAVLATTKCASFAGTVGAAHSYARKVPLPWDILVPAMAAALAASWVGARTVSYLDPALVRPAILAVLVALAIYTWLRPNLGDGAGKGFEGRWRIVAGVGLGAGLGFYDGFLGPGTGSMLVMALILIFGRDFLQASAAAKFVNGASNLGALMWFALAGLVIWKIALPMAVCNLAGGLIGSKVAMGRGNAWIRRVFLVVVWLLIARLGWNLFGP